MVTIDASVLRLFFLGISFALILSGLLYSRNRKLIYSTIALVMVVGMYLLGVFRDEMVNTDTIAYCAYFDMARDVTWLNFMLLVRFEPLSSSVMYLLSQFGLTHQEIFMALVFIIIGCQVYLYRALRDKYIIFAAATFPQFGFIMSMAIVRWAIAINVLCVLWVLVAHSTSFWKRFWLFLSIGVHYSLLPAVAIGLFRSIWVRLLIVIGFLATISMIGGWETEASGSGLRLLFSSFGILLLVLIGKLSRKDPGDNEFIHLVILATMISTLFLISPTFVRFANSVMIIAYLVLLLKRSPVRKIDFVMISILLLPSILSVGNEILSPTTISFEQGKLR